MEKQNAEYKAAMRLMGELSMRNEVVSSVRVTINALTARGLEIITGREVMQALFESQCYAFAKKPIYHKFWNAVCEIANYELLASSRSVESLVAAFNAFAGDSSYFTN